MSYVRGLGTGCDASARVSSVNGNYQCCPTDSACISEAGLAPGMAPGIDPSAASGVSLSLLYGAGPDDTSSTPWGLILLAALALAMAVSP